MAVSEKQIDFYLLPANSWMRCLSVVAQLAEKAYRQAHAVTIALESHLLGDQLDNLLWTQRPESYLPHQYNEKTQTIHLAKQNPEAGQVHIQCLIAQPSDADWSRLLQIVPNNAQLKDEARALYREYQKQNIPIQTHNLNKR